MKKTTLLLTLMMVMFMPSCSGNDEPEINPLIGAWTRYVAKYGTNGVSTCIIQLLFFYENGEVLGRTSIYVDGAQTNKDIRYTYEKNGNTITMHGDSTTQRFTYSIANSQLTMVGSDGTFVFVRGYLPYE